ncbi:MAG TPA: hypothetical protein VMI75_10470 [Polyangiaceae bacterium]|nr:hypothetical protein [Polyangiaceae bacterium]
MARKPTHADAELLLRLYEIRRDPELRRARAWFISEFKPGPWEQVKTGYLSHSDEDRWFRMTFSYWDMVAGLVNRGLLHDELFFDSTGEDIVTWERCKPWIEGARASIRPSYLRNFEKLVTNHLAFRAKVNAKLVAEAAGKPRAKARKR